MMGIATIFSRCVVSIPLLVEVRDPFDGDCDTTTAATSVNADSVEVRDPFDGDCDRRQVSEMVSSGTWLLLMGEVLLADEALPGNSYGNNYITKEQQVRETGLKDRGQARHCAHGQ